MTWLMRIAINLQKDHWRNRRMQFWRHARTNAVDMGEAASGCRVEKGRPSNSCWRVERVHQVSKAVEGYE